MSELGPEGKGGVRLEGLRASPHSYQKTPLCGCRASGQRLVSKRSSSGSLETKLKKVGFGAVGAGKPEAELAWPVASRDRAPGDQPG